MNIEKKPNQRAPGSSSRASLASCLRSCLPLAAFCSVQMTNVAQAPAPAPDKGYVPDEKTAIQITMAVLEGMQSKAFATSQKPFEARLENGVWSVEGRAHHNAHEKGGGGVEMRISQRTGKILGYYFAR